MPIPFTFDFKNPDYIQVLEWRLERLDRIKRNPECLTELKKFYKQNPAQFIIDWGMTSDPRNISRGRPAVMPFILFPKQEEWILWFMDCWRTNRPGVTAKTRGMGLSWMAAGVSAALCLFYDDMVIGFGSRKEALVDETGNPASIFFKVRQFVSLLPVEFRGIWNVKKHSKHMCISFPETKSSITGEAGDGLGRGGRTSIYFLDEAAWLPRPETVEASLTENTDCRQDISTVHGLNNPFAKKFNDNIIPNFPFHWMDDPRKDEEWYNKKVTEINDPIVIAQEYDINFSASVEGVVIPMAWINAAIDAHIKLGIKISGNKILGLDVADEGRDKNAGVVRHGILATSGEEWSGEGGDIYKTTEKSLSMATIHNCSEVRYDADGLGAGVRGDARKIKEDIKKETGKECFTVFTPHHGSGAVVMPDEFVVPPPPGEEFDPVRDRTNKDYFANYKAQSWFYVRRKFQLTYRAVVLGLPFDPDDLISIAGDFHDLARLKTELSQPTYKQNGAGKMLVDKKPDGAISPNKADAFVIAFAPVEPESIGWFNA